MSAPSGYTALDFVGFTDKGTYSPIVNYMRNDLVHYGGNIMRCLIDNTKNVTPVVGANWELWVGASANLVERVIAPIENNPADVAFGVGRQIIYDDWLWEVIAPIEVGDALIDYAVDPTNANIKKSAPVETQLLAVKAEADATDNMIAPTEASASSSSAAYSIGDQLILNNILYDVIADIQIGDALTTGTGGNIAAADTLTDQIKAKANSSDLGTAAAKDSTNAVTSGSTDLVESGAVASELATIDSSIQTLTNNKAEKSDLASISITGSTNNTGSTITSGTFFYLNGTLVSAKVDIANGAALTLNTNYEIVTAGGLNALSATISNQYPRLSSLRTILTSSVSGQVTDFSNSYDSAFCILQINPSASGTYVGIIYNENGNVIYSALSTGGSVTSYLIYLPKGNYKYLVSAGATLTIKY